MSASVCLSARQDISGTTRAIFTKFLLCLLPMAVARSSSDMLRQAASPIVGKGFSSQLTMLYNALAAKGIIQATNVVQHKGSFRRCRVR